MAADYEVACPRCRWEYNIAGRFFPKSPYIFMRCQCGAEVKVWANAAPWRGPFKKPLAELHHA